MFEKKMTEEEKKALQKEAKRAKREAKRADSKRYEMLVTIGKTVVVPFLLAAALSCLLFIVVRNHTLSESLKEDVVVARKDIAKNVKITPEELNEFFTVVSIDSEGVADTAYRSLTELPKNGFYTEEAFVKGQMVYREDVEESDFVMDKYKEDAVETSVSVNSFASSVCGTLRYGDIVDVYAVDPATDELVFVLGDVYILEAYNNSGDALTGKDGTATAFRVRVTPEEVEALNKAISWEGIQLYKK